MLVKMKTLLGSIKYKNSNIVKEENEYLTIMRLKKNGLLYLKENHFLLMHL